MSVPAPSSAEDTPCRACRTRDCCHDRDVAILADEVVRIARALAVAPERFVTLERRSDDEPSRGPSGAALVAGGERRRLVLRRRPDGAGRTRCVFLVTAGSGRRVCGLGELAPSACKAFPGPGRVAGKVAGCWYEWPAHEVAERADRALHDAAIARWQTMMEERPFPVGEAALMHALLADPALGEEAPPRPVPLPEPRSSSGCATCTTSRCCVVFDPELTGADLLRLVDGLGLDARDIGELRPVRADQAGADAVHLGDERAWELRLRRTAAQNGFQGPGGRRRCGFLVDLTHPDHAPASRCGVYDHRPLVCRLFPSDLTRFGVMVGTPEAICPPRAWSQERADLATLHRLHLVAQGERQRYREFLARWNAGSHGLADRPHEARSEAFIAALIAFERGVPRQSASEPRWMQGTSEATDEATSRSPQEGANE